jgi:hypothetical protein
MRSPKHLDAAHSRRPADWEMAAQQAFGAAVTRILSLSGTPFRTRGRGSIAFVETRDGKSIADYAYSYGDALADGVCRPLRFAAIGGTATFQTRRGGIETVSFDDDLNYAVLELMQGTGLTRFSPVKPQRWVVASFEHYTSPHGLPHPHIHNIVIGGLTTGV